MKSLFNIARMILVFGFLFSCATERPEGKTEAQVLFKEAQDLAESGRFIMATEKLNKIKSQYPYSYFATHAELLAADILFQQENFAESAAAYILFKEFHPKNEKLDYVIFRIAESYYFQIPETHDRDLSSAVKAIKYYEELLNIFPLSEYVKGAVAKIKKSKEMLWNKEKYIADFYFRTEVFDAARFRYLDILQNFSEPEALREHSMVKIVETSFLLNEKAACEKYFNQFYDVLKTDKKKKTMKSIASNCI